MSGPQLPGAYRKELEDVLQNKGVEEIEIYQSEQDLLAGNLSWTFQVKFEKDGPWLVGKKITIYPVDLPGLKGEKAHWELLLSVNDKLNGKEGTFSSMNSTVTVARDPNIKYGPEGNVLAGQKLDYKVEYENEGEGIAYGVYFTDTLDEDLNDSTLEIGPVFDVETEVRIGDPGIYNPNTRTITWFTGEVGPGQGGYAEFSVNTRSDAPDGTEIINFATVYFPSVPEATRTNGVVSIVRLNQSPIADAGGPYEGNEGSPINFDGSNSIDPDGNIVLYEWDLDGDGQYDDATGVNPSYTWNDDYSGNIGLNVTDNDGLTDTDSTTVTIVNVAPIANAGPDQTVFAGDTINFTGSMTDPGWLDIHTILWDFGDGTNASGTLTPSHTYYTKGTYTLTLTVTDDDGGAGIDTLQVRVKPIPATIRIEPETLNLASKGVFTAFITLPESYDVANIDVSTAVCEVATAVKGMISEVDKGTYIAKFNREDLVNVPTGDAVTLRVIGKVFYNSGLADFEGSDTIRVINQGNGKK